MLLRSVPQEHSHDHVVTFCESHMLVGEIVVGLGERCGDYVAGAGVGIRYGDSNLQGFEVVKRCLHWLR